MRRVSVKRTLVVSLCHIALDPEARFLLMANYMGRESGCAAIGQCLYTVNLGAGQVMVS